MSSEPGRGGNYLAIDGGVNPLSALYIIDEMFQRLKFDLGSEEDIRPCDWFDLIVGSGHGGLIALLLGRLQMKTPQAIEAYNSLASVLATEPTEVEEEREDNKARFMDAFRSIKPNSVDALMRTSAKENSSCKVAICALNAINRSSCQLIRSYVSRSMNAPQGTILQAACATIASPDAYNPVVIGKGGDVMSYIDSMAGYANPTNEMLTEAEKVFGKNGLVATIISIGSGKLDVVRQQESVNDMLRRILLDTESVHNNLQRRFGELGIYYRFSVENVISRNNREVTRAQVIAYLEEETNNQRMDGAVDSIHERKGLRPIKELNSISRVEVQYRQRPEVVSFFVGRQDILDRLHETHVRSPKPEGEHPTISVLTGLGGSGKTQIALQFAKEFQAINSKLLVFFVDASSEDRIKEDYQAIIRSRGIAHRTSTYEHALQWFASMDDPWLIIADNADEPKLDLHPFVPRCSRSHFIITSRNINLGLMARTRTYRVQELATDDSVKLLLDVSGYDSNNTNAEYATAIVRTLGYLPLAIVQAAGYIYKHKCLSSYLRLFNESREKLLAQKANELPHGYSLSVATTLEMSFNRLPLPSRQALCILSFLNSTSIPHQIIETAAQHKFYYASGKASDADREKLDEIKAESDALCRIFCPQDKWSEAEFNEIVEPCFQYSLLQSTISVNEQKFYAMHILVQSWLQIQSILHNHHSSKLLARRILLSVAQEGSQYQYFELHQMLLPHLRAFAGQPSGIATDDVLLYRVLSDCRDDSTAMIHMMSYMNLAEDKLKLDAPERLRALRDLTWTLVNTGHHRDAIRTGQEVVELCMDSLGREDSLTLTSMLNLASAYRSLGQYKDAWRIDLEVSVKSRDILGPEHLDTLTAMSNLADDHIHLTEYSTARKLDEETLVLRGRVLGTEHPDTLTSMGNLARDYNYLGEYKRSRDANKATSTLCRKILGPEHPLTLRSMNSLAVAYGNLGEHKEARELDEAALALHKKVLGPEHPYTLCSMNNLAADHSELGEYKKARELDEATLALRTKVLGPEHPETLQSMNNLAGDHSNLGEYEKARELDEATLALRTKILGPEHPNTLQSMNNLAVNYSNLGDQKKARELDEATLALRTKVLGPEHPDTLCSMNNLAVDYSELGEYKKARELDEATLALRTKVLGPEHPDTLRSMNRLAVDHSNLGEHKKARELDEATLSLRKKVLGPEHPDTLQSMNNLAVDHSKLREHREARELNEAILALRTKVLGPEHPDTLNSMHKLAVDHSNLGEYKKAQDLYEAVLALGTKVLGPEHPDTLHSMGNLATNHSKLGEHKKAREWDEATLALRTKVLGPEHPDTLCSMDSLAADHSSLREYEKARELDEAVLVLRTKVLGPEHPDTLNSMHNLAADHRDLGEYERARELYEAVLALRAKVLGSEHLDTLQSMSSLATIHNKSGEHKKAQELDEAALALRTKVLGSEHPDTLLLTDNLAVDHSNLGEHKKARELNEATLALRRKLLGTDHPATLDSMSRLACNYRSLGMYEKAQQITEEKEEIERSKKAAVP